MKLTFSFVFMPLIKFVSDLQQVGGFLWVLRFPDRHLRMFSDNDDIFSSKQSHVNFMLYVENPQQMENLVLCFCF
jgi:hypothetical protein